MSRLFNRWTLVKVGRLFVMCNRFQRDEHCSVKSDRGSAFMADLMQTQRRWGRDSRQHASPIKPPPSSSTHLQVAFHWFTRANVYTGCLYMLARYLVITNGKVCIVGLRKTLLQRFVSGAVTRRSTPKIPIFSPGFFQSAEPACGPSDQSHVRVSLRRATAIF